MKKAKIILFAITVLAVAGAVLAFKAQRFCNTVLYCTNANNKACTIIDKVISFSTFTNAVNPITITYCSTTTHAGGTADPCPYLKLTDCE